jgi:tousled-like kinase
MEAMIRSNVAREAAAIRQSLASDSARLGKVTYHRVASGISERVMESWEDGFANTKLREEYESLRVRKERLEGRMKEAKKSVKRVTTSKGEMLPPPPKKDVDDSGDAYGAMEVKDDLDAMEAEESVRMHLANLKKEESSLLEQEKLLEKEKIVHIRTLKRVQNEDSSRFRDRPKLHDRYVLISLLGKGGFSEVWKAHDLDELRDVAVKIHQLDSRWSEDKKRNYTKHVSREYEIHRDVRHPRIVSLLDVFEIDHNSFATVLEYCRGTDLDSLLKEHKTVNEKDARAILLQIVCGMRYLNTPRSDGSRQGIIHYDLKPGNILFDEYGDAKITDFGLSKIIDGEDGGDSMELTSQGAGTYWYLPPECFMTGAGVRISNKVDVWSIGVIYYQMLLGKRPFGDGMSQDRVLSNSLILNAKSVQFPDKPAISSGAKEFISWCLTHDMNSRPDIASLCAAPYLRQKKL